MKIDLNNRNPADFDTLVSYALQHKLYLQLTGTDYLAQREIMNARLKNAI